MDCYLRFSSEEYQVDDLSDPYVHLTNNSIQKNGDNFYKAYSTPDGAITIEGYGDSDIQLVFMFCLEKEARVCHGGIFY
jgi:hypothetical protein